MLTVSAVTICHSAWLLNSSISLDSLFIMLPLRKLASTSDGSHNFQILRGLPVAGHLQNMTE